MASLWRVLLFSTVFSSGCLAHANDYTDLYSNLTLQQAYATYAENLFGIWNEDLLGRLTYAERQKAANAQLDLPLTGRHKHPFDFYADPIRGVVTIPILSVKFLDDIITAMIWLDKQNCEQLIVSDYIGMIRYQTPGTQSRQQFPPPLTALQVPDEVLNDQYVYDVSGKALKSAIYFLMAHELAHVIYRHQSYKDITALDAQEQERQADTFALNLMRRISVPPIGMSQFLLAVSRFELAPGDFTSLEEYETYLRERSTHKLSSDRLLAIAQGIRSNTDAFTRGQNHPSQWRSRIIAVADKIQSIGNTLDDREIRNLQRLRSQSVTLSEISSACR